MKALVTGGTGFLGPYILYHLVDFYDEIVLVDPFTDSIEFNEKYFKFIDFSNYQLNDKEKQSKIQDYRNKIQVVKADITNPATLAPHFMGVDHVFHAAAVVTSAPKDEKRIHYPTNVEGTRNILKLCAEHNIKRLIYTSSFVALGPLTKEQEKIGALADESQNVKIRFKHPYINTKYEAGQVVDNFAKTANYDIITVCPTTVIGYGMDNMVTAAFLDYIHQKLPALPDGGVRRVNQVLAEDVGAGQMLAALKGKHGEKYILGGENLQFRDFLQMFGNVLGYDIPRSIPGWLAGMFVSIQGKLVKNPGLTSADFKASGLEWAYTTDKARKELDYHPLQINEETFIKPFIKYLLQENKVQLKYATKLEDFLTVETVSATN